jgi:hypothetical protein
MKTPRRRANHVEAHEIFVKAGIPDPVQQPVWHGSAGHPSACRPAVPILSGILPRPRNFLVFALVPCSAASTRMETMELLMLTKALHAAAIGGLGLFAPQGREMRDLPSPAPPITKDEMSLLFRAELYGIRSN